jgi:RES domain-containing protein
MRLWRIVRARHAATAFSGEGARRASARWNSLGVPIAYAAEHLSLAALELFVHVAEDEEPSDLVRVEAEFPLSAEEVARQQAAILSTLPDRWRYDLSLTHGIGDRWFAEKSSAVMLVPSVVIEGEWNILLNPEHAEAGKLKVVSSKPFRFDPRMFRR